MSPSHSFPLNLQRFGSRQSPSSPTASIFSFRSRYTTTELWAKPARIIHLLRRLAMEERHPDAERDIRLKTMLVMTGMDHLIAAMDEQRLALQQSEQNTDDVSSDQDLISATFLAVFQNMLDKFNAIEEKLNSIQLAHFALQHSCSSATEVAQDALKNVQRGNPYLSKIDTILTQSNDHDVTESIINSASDMIELARRDTQNFLQSLEDQAESIRSRRRAPYLQDAALQPTPAHSEHRMSSQLQGI